MKKYIVIAFLLVFAVCASGQNKIGGVHIGTANIAGITADGDSLVLDGDLWLTGDSLIFVIGYFTWMWLDYLYYDYGTVYESLLPDADQGADLGSSQYNFNLIYGDSIYTNYLSAALSADIDTLVVTDSLSVDGGKVRWNPTLESFTIGSATDQYTPTFSLTGDADSDGGATTSETLSIKLTGAATPTNATWSITSTQGKGYSFDEAIILENEKGIQQKIAGGTVIGLLRLNAGNDAILWGYDDILFLVGSGGATGMEINQDGDVSTLGSYNTFTDTSTVSDTWGFSSGVITALSDGLRVTVKVAVANDGAAELLINELGAKAIKKMHDLDLATGDVEVGQYIDVIYDGTVFQLMSPVAQ